MQLREMQPELTAATWRRAKLCGAHGQCIEIARVGDEIAMRDSKDPSGPILRYTQAEWQAFIVGAKSGDFDDL